MLIIFYAVLISLVTIITMITVITLTNVQVEPQLSSRDEFNNHLLLAQYKNKILHLFFLEALFACCMYSLGGSGEAQGTTNRRDLITLITLITLL